MIVCVCMYACMYVYITMTKSHSKSVGGTWNGLRNFLSQGAWWNIIFVIRLFLIYCIYYDITKASLKNFKKG